MWMTALGEKIKFTSPFAHCLADELFAIVITLGRVDHVQTSLKRAVQQFRDRLGRCLLITDLGSAKAEDGNLHVGFSKSPLFHI